MLEKELRVQIFPVYSTDANVQFTCIELFLPGDVRSCLNILDTGM